MFPRVPRIDDTCLDSSISSGIIDESPRVISTWTVIEKEIMLRVPEK